MFSKQLICVLLGVAFVSSAVARDKGATTPGTYQDWNGDIDEVTVVQPFQGTAYNEIRVESFDISGVKLPPAKDNTYEAVQSALRMIKPAFIDGLETKLRRTGANPGHGKLIIRARVTEADPGSQAARYWGGFGAGAVKIAIAGELIDAATNKTLVRFQQERRSGFGAFGGGYSELFVRTAKQIGGDIASLVNAF
jgi:hypothetical protein